MDFSDDVRESQGVSDPSKVHFQPAAVATPGTTPNAVTTAIPAYNGATNSTPAAAEPADATSTNRAPCPLTTDDIAAIVTLIVNTGTPPPHPGSTSRDLGEYIKCCHKLFM